MKFIIKHYVITEINGKETKIKRYKRFRISKFEFIKLNKKEKKK